MVTTRMMQATLVFINELEEAHGGLWVQHFNFLHLMKISGTHIPKYLQERKLTFA